MRVGVILTTYGEPTRNSFADQWMYSYRILRRLTRKVASIPAPLLPVIATSRARSRVSLWRRHRFVSGLEPLHERTVLALRAELDRRGLPDLTVLPAYEFRRPGLADALRRLRARGCERFIVIPMYIAEGDFTHGMTRIALDDALRHAPWCDRSHLALCSLTASAGDEERLADALARHCTDALERRGIPFPATDWALLLAAHGTVLAPPRGVDNGLAHFGRVLLRVKGILRPRFGLVRIGWLNHTRGGRWTGPAVPDALEIIRRRGFDKLVYFPWGFTTDNAETALEGRIFCEQAPSPFARVEHLECLNAEPGFIALLADRIVEGARAHHPAFTGRPAPDSAPTEVA